MKTLLIALGLCLIAADAQAISRYDPTRMSCQRVQATVADHGAVLLRYRSPRNPSLTLFDRYVASRRFCNPGEVMGRSFVPSADRDSCLVFRCVPVEHGGRRRPFFPFN